MEDNPNFPNFSIEDNDDNKKRRSKKKGHSSESRKSSDDKAKQKISKDIAKSLFRSRPEEIKTDEPKPKIESKIEASVELTQEEADFANRTLAAEHLDNPVIDDYPAQPVTDFLEKVKHGDGPEQAYQATLEFNLDEEQDEELVIRPASEEEISFHPPAPNIDPSLAQLSSLSDMTETTPLSHELKAEPEPLISYVPNYNINKLPTVNSETRPSRPLSNLPETTTLTAEKPLIISHIASYIIGKRQEKKQSREKIQLKQHKVERQVKQLEVNLIQKEITLQQLVQQRPEVIKAASSPIDRPKSSRLESRLTLTKPERIERIGKVIVDAERPVKEAMVRPNNLKDSFKPENVRTMHRAELLVISEKIIVEGASLKHMYDNSLFSERALRRLVTEYLKGRDINPILQREILEKQIDFERDPLFRDRNHSGVNHSAVVFDQILASVETSKLSQPAINIPLSRPKPSAQINHQAKANNSSTPLAYWWLYLLIGFLIFYIFYLLLHSLASYN